MAESTDLLTKSSLHPTPPTREEQHEEAVEQPEKPAKRERKASKPKASVSEHAIKVSAKDYDKYLLPQDESDAYWDAKMRNPVPESLIEGLADHGWDPTMAALVKRDAKGNLHIQHGRTRWRALEKANTLRKKAGKPPIEPVVLIEEEDDSVEGAQDAILRGMRLNLNVQDVDPMTLAEDIARALSAGAEERIIARASGITINDLHGYLLLTDEDKCPPVVQEMLRDGRISFSAALELARKAADMTKGELTAAAEQIAKVASGGVKVTSQQVKRAAGDSAEGPATKKQVKQFLLDLQSDKLTGKHGEAATMAAIVALEVGLGTRTLSSAKAALRKAAHGESIKIDFKQYQDGAPAKEVKGQSKAK